MELHVTQICVSTKSVFCNPLKGYSFRGGSMSWFWKILSPLLGFLAQGWRPLLAPLRKSQIRLFSESLQEGFFVYTRALSAASAFFGSK